MADHRIGTRYYFDTEYGYRVTDATYRESSKSVQCCEANIICQGLLKSCQGMTFFCEGLRKSCQRKAIFCEGLKNLLGYGNFL